MVTKEEATVRLCTRSVEEMCLDLSAFLESEEAEKLI